MKTILFLGSKTEHTDKALSFLASHAQVESYLESSWGKTKDGLTFDSGTTKTILNEKRKEMLR